MTDGKGSPIFTIDGFNFGPLHTMDQAKQRNAEQGFFYFSKETLRWFKSRISNTVHTVERTGGLYFVSSERNDDHPRLYSVAYMSPDGRVGRAAEFQSFKSASGAHAAARRLAKWSQEHPSERSPHDVARLLDRGSDDYRTHFGVIEIG